jgi:hypothetical protein
MSSEEGSPVPKAGSAEWKRNEKIINSTPFLRKMRAQSQLESVSEISTGAPSEAFKAGYDLIDWNMDWMDQKDE